MTRDEQLGLVLVSIARRAIGSKLGVAGDEPSHHAALGSPGASFVTLFCGEELRGCIGTLQARRPLGVDVRENAINAAFHDPRFRRSFRTNSSARRSRFPCFRRA